jgi:ATP adenylyltransferase
MTTRFSWITDPTNTPPVKIWDSILAESANFIALPSLGSLVPGWTLVVPKRPALCLAEMSPIERTELRTIVCKIRHVLGKVGHQVFEFEHGVAQTGSLAGCGVDQAHLHVVPLSFDLIDCLDYHRDAVKFEWPSKFTEGLVPETFAGSEYLWCSDGAARSRIGRPIRPESQWFRRVVARELGLASSWNYSEYPFEENILQTLDLFRSK